MSKEKINIYDVGSIFQDDKSDTFGKRVSVWSCDLIHNGKVVGNIFNKNKNELRKLIRIWLNAHTPQ